jgi:Tfp pilus assembly pilus retraction ATPase PilT
MNKPPKVEYLFELLKRKDNHAGSGLLLTLATAVMETNSTDVHIRCGNQLLFRSQGILKMAKGSPFEIICKNGGVFNEQDFSNLVSLIEINTNETKVLRMGGLNLRAQHIANTISPTLHLRFQAETPPDLVKQLEPFPKTLQHITEASGLVLIAGPIGGGKTTLGSSIAQHWANQNKHVLTIEDPSEYNIESKQGYVSRIHANLSNIKPSPHIELDAAIVHALRMDIDGLYVGETRNGLTMAKVLEFSSAQEPVLTTIHAGSIGDAIIRASSMLCQIGIPEKMVNVSLAQCLHGVFYVNLAYTENKSPIPIILYLPCNNNANIRKAITEMDPRNLNTAIEESLRTSIALGGITRQMAQDVGFNNFKIRKEQIAQALPNEVKN